MTGNSPSNPQVDPRLPNDKLRAYAQSSEYAAHSVTIYSDAKWMARDILRLTARVAELESEIRDYEGPKCSELLAENTQFTYQIVALEAERDRLRAALRKYGKHSFECSHYEDVPTGLNKREHCVCGLNVALAGAADEMPPKG